jgi:hypothetical protein
MSGIANRTRVQLKTTQFSPQKKTSIKLKFLNSRLSMQTELLYIEITEFTWMKEKPKEGISYFYKVSKVCYFAVILPN